MGKEITREDVLKAIEKVEHPEIAVTLMDLGMIIDAAVEGDTAKVAMALPMFGIPAAVQNALVESIRGPIEALGLQLNVQFFEMTPEARDNFFALSQANWKGSI